MFDTTLSAAELFANSIRCSNPTCLKVSDNLQMLGESCKHPFCWDCINGFYKNDTFVLCPLCKLPLELQRPSNCFLFNNLSVLLADLRCALTKYSSSTQGSSETQHILTALQPKEIPRTIDDFCSSQMPCDEDEAGTSHNDRDKDGSSSPVERSMKEDNNFHIETLGLENIGNPIDHSTQKDGVRDLFASQAVPEWNPCNAPERRSITSVVVRKEKSLPQEWIDESRARLGKVVLKRSAKSDVNHSVEKKRSSNRLSADKDKKVSVPIQLNSSYIFDEEDDKLLDSLPIPKCTNRTRSTREKNLTITESTPKVIEKKKSESKKSIGGKKGETVVVNAVITGNENKLIQCLEAGCNPDEKDPDGKTAIYLTAERNQWNLCIILIEAGAVVNSYCGEECWTPLHAAAHFNSMETAKVLVSRGASRRARDIRGRLPQDVSKTEEMALFISRHSSVPLQIVYPRKETPIIFVSEGVENGKRRKAADHYQVVTNISDANMVIVEGNDRSTPLNAFILESIARGMIIISMEWFDKGGDEMEYEVNKVTQEGVEYNGGCILSRKNRQRMMPPLFYGAYFYLCHSKYGSITKNEYIEIIKAGGGKILSREPMPSDDELNPFHNRELSPYFILFNPVSQVNNKLSSNPRLNCVSYTWLHECIGRFEIVKPY